MLARTPENRYFQPVPRYRILTETSRPLESYRETAGIHLMQILLKRVGLCAVVALSLAWCSRPACGQIRLDLGRDVRFAPQSGSITVQAVAGEPFGVGRMIVQLPNHEQPELLGPVGLELVERNSRVFYPAIDSPTFAATTKRQKVIDA